MRDFSTFVFFSHLTSTYIAICKKYTLESLASQGSPSNPSQNELDQVSEVKFQYTVNFVRWKNKITQEKTIIIRIVWGAIYAHIVCVISVLRVSRELSDKHLEQQNNYCYSRDKPGKWWCWYWWQPLRESKNNHKLSNLWCKFQVTYFRITYRIDTGMIYNVKMTRSIIKRAMLMKILVKRFIKQRKCEWSFGYGVKYIIVCWAFEFLRYM